jgi:type II secretory pathway component PulF
MTEFVYKARDSSGAFVTGALDSVAMRCASYYEAKLTERINKLTSIVGPAAIVFIAGIIVFLLYRL